MPPASFYFDFQCSQFVNTSLKTQKLVISRALRYQRPARRAALGGGHSRHPYEAVRDASIEKRTTVVGMDAMDGGLYEHYSEFSERLKATLAEMLCETVASTVIVTHANDGGE
ncbi:Hexokinase-1 [Platanthera guangdongensis]|uniref:Hexokinase-1 n=1 Tax=Platanthera guangdongensis TaxID=2320717 RepID=A0ABR2M640_9ASPA